MGIGDVPLSEVNESEEPFVAELQQSAEAGHHQLANLAHQGLDNSDSLVSLLSRTQETNHFKCRYKVNLLLPLLERREDLINDNPLYLLSNLLGVIPVYDVDACEATETQIFPLVRKEASELKELVLYIKAHPAVNTAQVLKDLLADRLEGGLHLEHEVCLHVKTLRVLAIVLIKLWY